MGSSFSYDYSCGAVGGSKFSVGVGDGKFGMYPRTIHLIFHIVDCSIYGGDFLLSQSIYYSSMSHSY